MLPEPTRTRRTPRGLATCEPEPAALHDLRSGVENLLTSTLTLLRQLRDGGLLTGSVRHQALLVAVDGGSLELALDAAFPDPIPSDMPAEHALVDEEVTGR